MRLSALVLLGPTDRVDRRTLRQAAMATLADLAVRGEVSCADDAAGLRDTLDRALADPDVVPVVLPGPTAAARDLMDADRPGADRIVWYDPELTSPRSTSGNRPLSAGGSHERSAGGGPPRAGGNSHQYASGSHLWGRGVDGLSWAIRHALHRRRWPAHRWGYGEDPEQFGELRLPDPASVPGPVPVAVLLHGGFWRSLWGSDLMDALAVDVAARGLASWNLEYRRPDRHGWAATVHDVTEGIRALSCLNGAAGAGLLDLDRTILIGHSAGAQLALRTAADLAAAYDGAGDEAADDGSVAADGRAVSLATGGCAVGEVSLRGRGAAGGPGYIGDCAVAQSMAEEFTVDGSEPVRPGVESRPWVVLAVSLAGVLDLVEADRRWLSTGATAMALGGSAEEIPQAYARESPLARVPLGVPQIVVVGQGDSLDFVDMSRRYAAAARDRGDRVVEVEQAGDHFDVIDPRSPVWHTTAGHITRHLSSG